MFTHDTSEKQAGVVEMKDVRFQPVKKCVDYFYTGKISTSEEGCEDLLYTSTLMQANPISDKIVSFLEDRLNPKSFYKTRNIALKFELGILKKACDDFALTKLIEIEIVKEPEFNQLGSDYVSFLITSKKSTGLKSEDSKLAIVLQWIKADPENRRANLNEMMSLVLLENLSQPCVKHIIEEEPLFYQSTDLLRGLVLTSMKSGIKSSAPKVSFPLNEVPNSLIVFDLSVKSLQAYFPETGTWVKMHPLVPEMCGSTYYISVAKQNSLYVFMENKKAYRLNIKKEDSELVQLEDMLQKHGDRFQAVPLDDYIYIFGKDSMERFCEVSNQWEKIDARGMQCHNCALIVGEKQIYFLGGYYNNILKRMSTFSPNSKTWSSAVPMEVEREAPAALTSGNRIYVAGGCRIGQTISDVECFDLMAKTWTRLANMNKCRCLFRLCVIGEKLYAIGNYSDPCTIEEYDEKQNTWRIIVDEPNMKVAARATVAMYLPK